MTSMLVKTFRKTAVERRRLYLDYTCFLEETEKLTSTQVTIIPYSDDAPLSVTTGYSDATQKKLVMFVGGGKGNTTYTMQVVVNTDAGQVKRDDIGMLVLP